MFLLGGLLAGVVNTLAGYGSIITLSLLMNVGGLAPNVANGSNRIGILSNCAIGAYSFYKNGKLTIRRARVYVLISLIGAIPGVILATQVTDAQFRNVFRVLVVSLFFFMLTKPSKWLIEKTLEVKVNYYATIPIFLAIGFYGGFIQFGLGLFILAALVLMNKIELIEANAIKLALIAVYTIVVLAIFQYHGLVNWYQGAILAVGQGLGAYYTAKYAANNESVRKWTFYLLIIIVILIILREAFLLYQELN